MPQTRNSENHSQSPYHPSGHKLCLKWTPPHLLSSQSTGTTMATRALRILIVSQDRTHLRDCYDFFIACGYDVVTQHLDGNQQVSTSSSYDVLVYDHPYLPGELEVPFRIAIVASNTPKLIQKAIEYGADDVVVRPLSPAKLLVRVRAAAQVLESRSVVQTQFGRAAHTRFPGEGCFLGTMQSQIEQISYEGHCVCASLFSLANLSDDHYDAWLETLEQTVLPDTRIFELSERRVATVVPSALPEQAISWMHQVLDGQNRAEGAPKITASFISTRCETASSEKIGLVLNDRLNLAMSLGQGLLLDDQEESNWRPQPPTGSIFDGMTAEDIMRPLPIKLHESDVAEVALAKLRQWDTDIAPVIDEEGKLCGPISIDDLSQIDDASVAIGRYCLPNVPRIASNAPLQEFVALFSSHDSSWLVVMHENQPIGIIHCDDLTNMNTPAMVSLA